MNDKLPVSMHPRYNDFLRFMENCPYRKTPSIMETAFWAWINVFEDFERLLEKSKSLIDELNKDENQTGAL